jgi:competence protein ComEC
MFSRDIARSVSLDGARVGSGVPLPAGEVRWPQADPGDELVVSGFARTPESSAGADFDWAGYPRRRGIAGELELESVWATGGRRGAVMGLVDRMRERAERALAARAPPPEAALIRGMVLGQDQDIDELVRDDFRASGLAHIL